MCAEMTFCSSEPLPRGSRTGGGEPACSLLQIGLKLFDLDNAVLSSEF